MEAMNINFFRPFVCHDKRIESRSTDYEVDALTLRKQLSTLLVMQRY